jgi:hypothetical protein
MARRNLRLIAERTGWPDGAIDACEALNADQPDLVVVWRPANTTKGFEYEAGFYAYVSGDDPLHNGVKRREWYGETIDQLRQVLPTGRGPLIVPAGTCWEEPCRPGAPSDPTEGAAC